MSKLFLLSVFLALPLAAQTALPDQFVAAGGQYDQSSSPSANGFVAYAKLADKASGLYSYTRILETSVNLKPKFAVQTQTETGVCVFTKTFGVFDVFTCATGGIAAAGGSTGASASGSILITKQLGRGWTIGFAGGPSYSGVIDKVTYPVGIIFGWGR